MPPWHAEAPAGTFHNERSLSDRERETLTAWAAGGALNGDPKDLPAAADVQRRLVARQAGRRARHAARTIALPAKGTIQYEWFYIPTNFTEAKWVKSIEVQAGQSRRCSSRARLLRAKPDRKVRRLRARTRRHQCQSAAATSRVSPSIRDAGFEGNAATARGDVCARHESAGRAGRNGFPA